MCGIAGIWHLNREPLDREKLIRFTDSMTERGPDGSGYGFFDNHTLGLGHRRLSILDLSDAGKQPMAFANGRYHITYNGEIFNFEEIRRDLETLGHRFHSHTDTEVVLAAFVVWGSDCLNRFNGMWALAIWDEQEKTLFMARDRFGIKPFYYVHEPGRLLAFASETRAFKQLDDYRRSMDEEMLQWQMQGARIHGSGYTIYKGIHCLLPGHFVLLKQDGPFEQKRWWHIQDHLWNKVPDTLEAQAEQYRALLQDACKIRLVSDVPVATALSGGLDSSSVYCTVSALFKQGGLQRVPADAQRAVVATFPGLENDERAYAEQAIEYTGGDALFLPQEYKNLPEQVEKDTLLFDGLNASPITAISGIYRGMRAAGITVSMDGHGVDEMQYGYRDMLYNLFDYFHKSGNTRMTDTLREVIVPTYPETDHTRVEQNLRQLMQAQGLPARIKRLIKQIIGRKSFDRAGYNSAANWPSIGQPYHFEGLAYPEQVVYQETFVETLPDIFRNFDLAGMMNSVEIRMPFMDWRLVAYTLSLPLSSKVGNGYNKLVLREAMKNRMPESLRQRRLKIGISSPIQAWLNGPLRVWALDILNSVRSSEPHNGAVKSCIHMLAGKQPIDRSQAVEIWQTINLALLNS
ncbi:MAG: asparagine synthase (glutamine-hydrolyzing) [Sphingomonadales bacterium]|nr:asparagine synthase (glutamine-hydrolyzing) [Sphingomonadales bacterium]